MKGEALPAVRTRDMADFRPEAPQHAALWEHTVETLRLAILRGDLPPGTQLVEAELAEKLNVSRGPIREALRQLEIEGFVETYPRRGSFVVGVTENDVREIYDVRLLLETHGITLATQHHTPEDIAQLTKLISEMGTRLAEQRLDTLALADLAFHRTIMTMAGNKRLLAVWEASAVVVKALLTVAEMVYQDMERAVGNHGRLVDAIERRNAAEAVRLMHDHLLLGEEIVLQAMRGGTTVGVSTNPETAP
jgi:GntR family transcriptional regulator of gluconate operon